MFLWPTRIVKHFTPFVTTVYGSTFVSCKGFSDYAAHESSKYMKKLLNKRGAKTKKKWYQPHLAEPNELIGVHHKPYKKGATPAQKIRAVQLSHVLYSRITQIINTGELSEEILNKQVLITDVKMHADFGSVNVYWDSQRSDSAEIETLLLKNAKKLRGLLISYHVLGQIPPINFVKGNKTDLALLKQLFEVADYGPDYFPSSIEDNTFRHNLTDNLVNKNPSESFPDLPLTPSSSGPATSHKDARWRNFLDEPSKASNAMVTEDNSSINLTDGLNFRSNLYGLPQDILMKKVRAQRTKVKFQGEHIETQLKEHNHNFSVKQLNLQKDRMKLLSMKGSTKTKQKLLERDFDDNYWNPPAKDREDYSDSYDFDEYDDEKIN